MHCARCVGGGAPVNFGRRRGGGRGGFLGGGGARRRSQKVGVGTGGAVLGAQNCFSKISEKISFYPQNFLMTLFSHGKYRKLQQNKYIAKIASAARRQIIGCSCGGAPINKSRRRPHIVCGAACL